MIPHIVTRNHSDFLSLNSECQNTDGEHVTQELKSPVEDAVIKTKDIREFINNNSK